MLEVRWALNEDEDMLKKRIAYIGILLECSNAYIHIFASPETYRAVQPLWFDVTSKLCW